MPPFQRVAAYAPPGAVLLALGIVSAVFKERPGIADFSLILCSDQAGPLRTDIGTTVQVEHDLAALETADLVLVLPGEDYRTNLSGAATAALRAAHERGAIVAAHCLGVFLLAHAGLLDGLDATTHWQHAAELARRFPAAKVDPDVLYVDDDPVITSAGTAAGIDACLYLVRKEQGMRVANGIARRMVVPPHRDGGQAQYVQRPVAPTCGAGSTLRDLLEWLQANLDKPVAVRQLAARANMSERTLARRFVQDTGTTPQRWLTGQRILLAQQLLEETDETVDYIAERCGFGNAMALRHHFRLWRQTTPHAYRTMFRCDSPVAAMAKETS